MSRPKALDPRSSLAAALGAKVRKSRVAMGWTQQELADRVYVSASRIAQIELATDPPNEYLSQDLDRVLKADDEINVAWWHMNRAQHREWVRQYIDLEKRATRMRKYAPQLVPGILQTPDYARCLFRVSQPGISQRELERLVQLRMNRRSILEGDDPLYLWVVLDESILLRPFGDVTTTRGQLKQLLEMSELPHIALQVLPFKAGAHGAMDGALTLMDFPDGPSAAYLEGAGTQGEVVESPQAVKQYAMIYDRLMVKALSPEDSRDLIRATLEERYACPPPSDGT
ncbi:helix-turn-helix domain-containing protein [Streptomyces daliensis]|uniref:Helix-turn-helix transcriptional regulator n=1 Tax=Streptomyces daliensis TaxID=299421 RepID=A0A8T4J3X2_9ACTN|nr:helix-turn-helix transcriptional regulator [Streptomyces daliensis]